MTLIRRMHSLGRGEGRVGWLSNGKYMHWLQDELGLGSRWEWKLCPWAARLSETSQGRAWGAGGWGATEALLRWPCQCVCLQFALWEACYQKRRGKKWRKETEIIETERETTTTTTATSMDDKVFPKMWCKVHEMTFLETPPLKNPKEEMLYFTQYFLTLATGCKVCGDQDLEGQEQLLRRFAGARGRAECQASGWVPAH